MEYPADYESRIPVEAYEPEGQTPETALEVEGLAAALKAVARAKNQAAGRRVGYSANYFLEDAEALAAAYAKAVKGGGKAVSRSELNRRGRALIARDTQPAVLLRDTDADRERLVKRLPQILAETDEAGSDADDWAGSEYVERLADAILAALRGAG